MSFWKALRKLYIKTTNFTHGFQGENKKILDLYRLWNLCYDFSIKLDPAYMTGMRRMIDGVLKPGDTILDIGCGTGLGAIYASRVAGKVVGIDPSLSMVNRLKNKMRLGKIENIEVIIGGFPESLPQEAEFDAVISSFAFVHIPAERRGDVYKRVFTHLFGGGRVGLFSARGEIAPAFETREEVVTSLRSAGFKNIRVDDVFDIYRIVTAERP